MKTLYYVSGLKLWIGTVKFTIVEITQTEDYWSFENSRNWKRYIRFFENTIVERQKLKREISLHEVALNINVQKAEDLFLVVDGHCSN